ncbi:MAG: hypothetical protein JWN03_4790 [Nocardia sp.]|nr:hypothetical protein [Nocardia sp.]
MSEIEPTRTDVAPSVKALLAEYHSDTPAKLALAPPDSRPILHDADGRLQRVTCEGWLGNGDEDMIGIAPARGHDTDTLNSTESAKNSRGEQPRAEVGESGHVHTP